MIPEPTERDREYIERETEKQRDRERDRETERERGGVKESRGFKKVT